MASNGPKAPTRAKAATPKPVAAPKAPRAKAAKPRTAIEVAPEAEPELPKLPAVADLPEPTPPLPEPVVAAPAPVVEKAAEPAEEVVTPPSVEPAPLEPAALAAPVSAPEKEPVMATNPNLNTTAEAAADKSKAAFTDLNDRTRAAMERGTKAFEEINELSKGHLEAFVESSKIAAKGAETFGQEAADYGRRSFEQATAVLKSLAAAKTPTEFFKIQNDYVRTSFDALVAETSKNTEALLKLAGDVAQPISNRVAVTVEKAKITA
jgi:phasin family protein